MIYVTLSDVLFCYLMYVIMIINIEGNSYKTFCSSLLVPILKYVFLLFVYRCILCFLVPYDYYVNVCFYLRIK